MSAVSCSNIESVTVNLVMVNHLFEWMIQKKLLFNQQEIQMTGMAWQLRIRMYSSIGIRNTCSIMEMNLVKQGLA